MGIRRFWEVFNNFLDESTSCVRVRNAKLCILSGEHRHNISNFLHCRADDRQGIDGLAVGQLGSWAGGIPKKGTPFFLI
jgi:hypothetical protein